MDNDTSPPPSLPACARLPINRCNLPAVILGSLTYQQHPTPLMLDGLGDLHRYLWQHLDTLDTPELRAEDFKAYMRGHFCLDDLSACGLEGDGGRGNADYLRLVRGWWFNPDGREAAVLKGWVESRFGLMTRFHRQPLTDNEGEGYARFMHERTCGLYNTNALESQMDLLFGFCQYELGRQYPEQNHLTLYRGVNGLEDHEVLWRRGKRAVVLFNNVNAFSSHRERADEFGDYILTVRVPLAKVCCFQELLPGLLRGEGEHLVIGGVYEVSLSTL
ncbi:MULTISPECIES: NAD(+)--dinitrogen-reductase ADP-D-ribosyltransferase [Ectothiorhodospira]|uniref:NAD(+)--dinitrogen-reductase ADP-D-ribosyltransferase n=1 Tax=Ectothiorhodospira TaxID=1051 RepID=UPI001EE92E2D|nr:MULTISPECIES: NAD(+)--dinitrogen-reductase ADP-D-ribosyltransferase [Ectothiorhodospira]MCG5495176.1 NAD(+)--dinitrogen-reductase ADP-D-ribosyltransferase [Ectothiorhodospira variabilis]MCG5498299.1 NAD(+)--dinitrogen-reductase ADP-D-ribosyltransferase [Ectothiorhodospira variabilis]MCG5503870.1 NAD(+)--dinitrogen-reductase ADP-D-ribosyltransferase [Ectothiorhodospira variabilis]MCG5506999.1 NAD(+)--dinitrogen-reductase ADP-D-ribosyltransferase [Ectothiorhodospira variabilis]MCG5525519.1 NA